MLEEKDFAQIRDYVIRILPELLRQEPEIATTIEGILAEHFPRRDEFARMLDELAKLREDMNRRLELLRQEMNEQFLQAEQRLGLLREEIDQRFGQMHETQLGMKQDLSRVRSTQEGFLKRLDAQDKWLQLVSGRLGEEKGRTLEDMFAVALQYGLKNPHITPEKIRLRQDLVDQTGECFPARFKTEVDLIAENDQLTVFEIKATAKRSDVSFFSLKVKLVANQNPDKQVRGVFISLGASPQVRELCDEYGVDLLDGLE